MKKMKRLENRGGAKKCVRVFYFLLRTVVDKFSKYMIINCILVIWYLSSHYMFNYYCFGSFGTN